LFALLWDEVLMFGNARISKDTYHLSSLARLR
jgi:hypothetical protein